MKKPKQFPPNPIIKEITVRGNILLFELEKDNFKETDKFCISYGSEYDDAFKSRHYKELKKDGRFLKFRTTWLPIYMCLVINVERKDDSNKWTTYGSSSDYLYLNTKIQGICPPELWDHKYEIERRNKIYL